MSDQFHYDLLTPEAGSAVADQPPGTARRDFLRRLVVGGGALTMGGAVLAEFAPMASAASTKTDITILNAALVLEDLGRTFYADALKHAKLSGEVKRFATVVHEHEVAHFNFVKSALGRDAKQLPSFDFGTRTHSEAQVIKTAVEIEGICTAALVGVTPLVTRKLLKSAGRLLPVEAQHVAWASNIHGQTPAPAAFNVKDTIAGVETTVAPLLKK